MRSVSFYTTMVSYKHVAADLLFELDHCESFWNSGCFQLFLILQNPFKSFAHLAFSKHIYIYTHRLTHSGIADSEANVRAAHAHEIAHEV